MTTEDMVDAIFASKDKEAIEIYEGIVKGLYNSIRLRTGKQVVSGDGNNGISA